MLPPSLYLFIPPSIIPSLHPSFSENAYLERVVDFELFVEFLLRQAGRLLLGLEAFAERLELLELQVAPLEEEFEAQDLFLARADQVLALLLLERGAKLFDFVFEVDDLLVLLVHGLHEYIDVVLLLLDLALGLREAFERDAKLFGFFLEVDDLLVLLVHRQHEHIDAALLLLDLALRLREALRQRGALRQRALELRAQGLDLRVRLLYLQLIRRRQFRARRLRGVLQLERVLLRECRKLRLQVALALPAVRELRLQVDDALPELADAPLLLLELVARDLELLPQLLLLLVEQLVILLGLPQPRLELLPRARRALERAALLLDLPPQRADLRLQVRDHALVPLR